MSTKEILIEIWADAEMFVQQYIESLGILNHLFDNLSYGELKIHHLENDHFLLEFKDEQAFDRFCNFPVLSTDNFLQKLHELQSHFLSTLFLTHKFPQEGLTISYKFVEGFRSSLNEKIENNFQQFNEVDFVKLTPKSAEIRIKSLDAFYQYSVLLFTLIQDRLVGLV